MYKYKLEITVHYLTYYKINNNNVTEISFLLAFANLIHYKCVKIKISLKVSRKRTYWKGKN